MFPIIWATFVRKFVTMNIKKLHNLVTLIYKDDNF